MLSERERIKLANKEMKKPVTKFKEIDLSLSPYVPKGMTRAFRNTRYTVMIYDNAETTHGPAINILVQRLNNTPIPDHWKELQKIKNEIFGPETTAVEYYPAESQLIDDKNIYWLWIFPEGVLPIPKIK